MLVQFLPSSLYTKACLQHTGDDSILPSHAPVIGFNMLFDSTIAHIIYACTYGITVYKVYKLLIHSTTLSQWASTLSQVSIWYETS